jgi:NAD(P)-dependent dehydrogenase (short-subunit alcohol dehydrogenase family)
VIDLSGKHILVTGASSGIGREVAVLASQLGANLTIVGRNVERIQETLSSLRSPDAHKYKVFDFAEDNLMQYFSEIIETSGKLAGVVHCAGIHEFTPLNSLNMKKVESILSSNTLSAFEILKYCSRRHNLEPKSSLVFLSSVAGFLGQPGVSAYSASKGAILALVKSAALELARQGTRVNAIAPGVVSTEMTNKLIANMTDEQFKKVEEMHPLGIGTPRDVANAAVFLLSDASQWITGTTLVVDGGYSSA